MPKAISFMQVISRTQFFIIIVGYRFCDDEKQIQLYVEFGDKNVRRTAMLSKKTNYQWFTELTPN
jgi:hypothetical protein